MSVVGTASELPDSPQGSLSDSQHELTRMFRVVTDDINDGPLTVTSAIGIPRMFQLYSNGNESHSYARVRSIDANRMAPASKVWIVEVKYETPPNNRGQEQAGSFDQPLIELPEVSTSFETFQKPILSIYNTTTEAIEPLQSSAGEPFENPPSKDEEMLTLTITRNEDLLSPHPALSLTYMNVCNSDIFWGALPGQVKCTNISAARQTRQLSDGSTVAFLKCSYAFKFRGGATGWDIQLLDHGSYYLDEGGLVKVAFLTEEGVPRKGLLDGNGADLQDGNDPVYLTIRPYLRLPFSLLNLPQSYLDVR